MKKYIIILFVISFCSVGPIAGQNIQLERWVVGNSVVDFNDPVGSTYASTNLPTIGSTSGVTSGIYDESGNTLFYTVNHIVYNNTGQVAGSLLSISSNHDITDVCIVPVPGECDKYFVVYVSTSSQYAAMYYSEVEIQNNQPIVTSCPQTI